MTGQHRAHVDRSRPGRAAAAVAAGVATATGPLAISTIVAPTVAEAAPASENWDAVAACESSGNWSINSGNGFSGGLQFTDSTWRAFGGRTPHAYQATRAEQIAIAENVLDGQGIGAWPVCGKRGLSGGANSASASAATRSARSVRSASAAAPRVSGSARAGASSAAGARVTPPAVPDQPRAVQQAVAASGPTNPACVSLKHRGVPVGQLDALNRAHPELHLDGNGNGIPCDVSFPRTTSNAAVAPTAARVATTASARPASSSSATGRRAAVVATARTFVGVPYRFGGESRAGVDCSGLVALAFGTNGVRLPRTADAQMRASSRIARSAVQPGDLAFSVDASGHAYHVGIVVDSGHMIDAPHTGTRVAVHAFYPSTAVFGRVL